MENELLHIIIYGSFGILLLAMAIALVRLIKGPDSSDRIVALDLIASIVMGFILLYSVLINKDIYFDIVIVISMISFMGTIGLSIYLRNKQRKKPDQ